MPFEHFVYDGKKVNRLRQFAVSNTLQILVINIDAFRKNFVGTEDEKKSNLFYRETDKLPGGHSPVEFVTVSVSRTCSPVETTGFSTDDVAIGSIGLRDVSTA